MIQPSREIRASVVDELLGGLRVALLHHACQRAEALADLPERRGERRAVGDEDVRPDAGIAARDPREVAKAGPLDPYGPGRQRATAPWTPLAAISPRVFAVRKMYWMDESIVAPVPVSLVHVKSPQSGRVVGTSQMVVAS